MQIGENISIHEYWQRVLAIAADLPDIVTVIAEADSRTGAVGGAMCEVDKKTAAQLIFARSHRIATDQEIVAYEAAQAKERIRLTEVEYKKKQQYAMPPEMANIVALAAEGLRESQKRDKKRQEQG